MLGVRAAAGPAVGGDGGIVSTVDDLARFYRALLGEQLLGSDELSEMTRHVDAGLQDLVRAGLGLFRFLVPCGFAWGHAGEEPLYSSISLASRDGSRVVVVAQNSSGLDTVKAVADEMYCG